MSLTPHQIRHRLKAGGWTLERVGALAPDGPMSRAMISRNVAKQPGYLSYRAQVAIAKALGLSRHNIFGSRTVEEQAA